MKNLLTISTLLVVLHFALIRTDRTTQELAVESLVSTPTDILTPYSDYPRFGRSTTNTIKDNFTHFYETQDPNVNEWAHVQTLQFIDSTTETGRSALGTVTFVDHPRTTFSVLEPFSPGSCNSFWPAHATVSVTASRRSGGCIVAQNAGFFRMGTSACLGNIVSDGRFVRESDHVVNANFGIKESGKIFVGYLSNEEAKNKTDPFLQLLSGVIWLVKNGSNFVNESMRIESDHNEETGNLTEFVNVVSARTAVGHDKLGRVMMLVVDGQTRKRGVNLFELADIMIRRGAVNAINLDGGGSATLMRDGVLANHVSDHCTGSPEYRCMRQVSTVLCAHEESCVPQDCNKRGECVGGECQCKGSWTGRGCTELLCTNATCGEHGSCDPALTANECTCEDGWIGELCDSPCPAFFYGSNCKKMCWCPRNGMCHPETGACTCSPGFRGAECKDICPEGMYGEQCQGECHCSENQFCHYASGCEQIFRCLGQECNISIIQVNSRSTSTPSVDTSSITTATPSSKPFTTASDKKSTVSTATRIEDTTADTKDTTADTEDTTADIEDTTADTEDTTADTEDTTADTKDTTADTKDTTADTEDTTADTKDTTADAEDTTADTKDTTADAEDTTADSENTTAGTEDTTTNTEDTTADTKDTTADTEDTTTNTEDTTTDAEEYAPTSSSGLEGFLGWDMSSSCIRSMLLSYLPLALCSCLSNILICFFSWLYWGGYKRRMLKRRGKFTIERQQKKENLTGRRLKQKEGNMLQKIIKPLPSSYQLVSTQLVNESSDSNSS